MHWPKKSSEEQPKVAELFTLNEKFDSEHDFMLNSKTGLHKQNRKTHTQINNIFTVFIIFGKFSSLSEFKMFVCHLTLQSKRNIVLIVFDKTLYVPSY